DGAVKRYLSAGLLAVLMAAPAAAQQSATPLGDLARQAEAARATARKATKSYTNADLAADANAASMPAPNGSGGYMSISLGREITAEEMIARSQAVMETLAKARATPEPIWRQKAAGIRERLANYQQELAVLRRPADGVERPAAAVARTEKAIERVRQSMARLRQQWDKLDSEARTAGIPLEWIEPRPVFNQ
ncbi:MAG TPA: hypothetical protein VEA16_06710, partial [Vicinamibacterales bacterium]|nr:hypothetical protein [Vicinamibacterales bacterium]